MPDLSVSRQDILAKQVLTRKQTAPSYSIGGMEFPYDNLKMSISNSLFQTVIKGNINKVRHLLARGININAKNDYGFSPLVAALHIEDGHKRSKMFELLIEKGASLKVKDTAKTKRSILHWACALGQVQQVANILEESAGDIDLQDKDGDGLTALHHAVKIGSFTIVDTLVNYHVRFGVSVDTVDSMGLTPYMHARRLGYKDVASVLKMKGLASTGHGDYMFRSPREWSQIGKFERKKAIVLENQDRINAFKIMGKVSMLPVLENSMCSPRMAIPGIAMPSLRPDPNDALSYRKPPHHLSASLPSLSQAPGLESDTDDNRPLSASRKDKSKTPRRGLVNDKPGPPMVAFGDPQAVSSDSSFKSIPTTNNSNLLHNNRVNHHSTRGGDSESNRQFITIPTGATNQSGVEQNPPKINIVNASGTDSMSRFQPFRRDSNVAMNLLQHTTKGRMVNQFRQSEFDTTKEVEYKQMLGNLNSIMDVLAHQNTKSFRKSVEIKKPETPPKVKKKKKVSSLAIIFGNNGRRKSGRGRKAASPVGKSQKGKEKREKSAKQKKGDASKPQKSKSKTGNANLLAVPSIKIS